MVTKARHERFHMLWLHIKVLITFASVSLILMLISMVFDHSLGIIVFTPHIIVAGNVVGILVFEMYCRFVQTEHTIYRSYGQVASYREFSEWNAGKKRDYDGDPEQRAGTSRLDQYYVQSLAHGDAALDSHAVHADLTQIGRLRLRTRVLSGPIDTNGVHDSLMHIRIGQPNGLSMECTILSVSGMAIGTLTKEATAAISQGAAGQYVVVTGEGGLLEKYHLAGGADCKVIFQFGTGYFGCRDEEGNFDLEKLVALCKKYPQIKGIQIKLGQGVKNVLGSFLPGAGVTPMIAEARGVPEGKDCASLPTHTVFGGIGGLVRFIETVRNATELPVSIKVAVGSIDEVNLMCGAFAAYPTGIPDSIQVDGGEGGTGASYVEMMGRMAHLLPDAIQVFDLLLRRHNIREKTMIIASGQNFTAEDIIRSVVLGADACATARGAKYALGCVAAGKCHLKGGEKKVWWWPRPIETRGECPSGVTSNGKYMNVPLRASYLRTYLNAVHRRTAIMAATLGIHDYRELIGTRTQFMDIVGVKIWTPADVETEIRRERNRLPFLAT